VSRALVVLAASFGLGLALTLLAERVAPRLGVVARPKADRWHRREVPLLGGVAIAAGTTVPLLAAAPGDARVAVLVLAALAMAVIGLVDDVRSLSPQGKLLAQILLAVVLLHFGFELRTTGYAVVDVLVTLVWVVGITNAFNLLDNMDGLSATIALVTVAFRMLFFHWEGDAAGVTACAAFAGAVAGFLVRNHAPARIFMGDAGSLYLGFFLAGLSIGAPQAAYSRGVFAVLVIPVLLLLIPIFDTAFVTLTRMLAGRSPAVGGRDHTSHRLVAVGLSERQTVGLLAAISAAAGGVAVLSYRVGLTEAVVLLALLVIALVLLGVHLGRVRVVHSVEAPEKGTVLRLLADFQYKRQVATLALDVCLILVAYHAAYLIRFEESFGVYRDRLDASLPIVLPVQLVAFAGFGLYRSVWRYTGIADVIRIVKAATVGTMATLVVLIYATRFEGYSRTVFILDWVLLIVLVVGSRASFRLFGEFFRTRPESFARVLVYGAGGGGELLVRELQNNPALERVPVGFIDDDRSKHHTRIHGVPVLGGSESIESILAERGVAEVIVTSAKIGGGQLEQVAEACRRRDVPIRRATLKLE